MNTAICVDPFMHLVLAVPVTGSRPKKAESIEEGA